MDIKEKENIEINFWRDAAEEKPEVFSIPNLINKFKEADVFFEKLVLYGQHFKQAKNVFELGGGQGWASCMVKFYHPGKHVLLSDISPFAIESSSQWEDIFKVKLDGKKPAKSYETGLENESQDLIFCFASAHHFIKHNRTFKELNRVLKPGGTILYFHEPVCRRFFYPLSYKRANALRPEVPEDVLIYKRIKRISKENGFSCEVNFAPISRNRGTFGTLYYWFLGKASFLQHIFPCSADFVFTKMTSE